MKSLMLEFGPESSRRLQEIANSEKVDWITVVRRALSVYDKLFLEKRLGSRIIVKNEGYEREIAV